MFTESWENTTRNICSLFLLFPMIPAYLIYFFLWISTSSAADTSSIPIFPSLSFTPLQRRDELFLVLEQLLRLLERCPVAALWVLQKGGY